MLLRIEPMLGQVLETKKEKTAVAMTPCGKYASITIDLLFSTRSMQMSYKEVRVILGLCN
jgi:hypothetical protein